MAGERDRGCATDTALRRRAGDDCDFALKKHEGYLWLLLLGSIRVIDDFRVFPVPVLSNAAKITGC
ncbi:hypothetical protein ALP91_00197 [Pseudomonas savastanoi pv. glycinea]|nr:Unknown protein sequence [Pseudomonas savastanoi pv. phaseolicola]RMR41891.1 hypothetical protein ALP91_00197 [Pseudomonas savastanoi pv. glycinea]